MSSFSPSCMQVEREQRRLAAGGADGVVDLLQPALGAGGQHAMRAEPGQFQRQRRADAARGAGDERDASGERLGISSAALRAGESCRSALSACVGQRDRVVAGEAGVAEVRLAGSRPGLPIAR